VEVEERTARDLFLLSPEERRDGVRVRVRPRRSFFASLGSACLPVYSSSSFLFLWTGIAMAKNKNTIIYRYSFMPSWAEIEIPLWTRPRATSVTNDDLPLWARPMLHECRPFW